MYICMLTKRKVDEEPALVLQPFRPTVTQYALRWDALSVFLLPGGDFRNFRKTA